MGPLIPVALAIAAWGCSPRFAIDEKPQVSDASGGPDGYSFLPPPDAGRKSDASGKDASDGSYVELPKPPDGFVSDATAIAPDSATPDSPTADTPDVAAPADQKTETHPSTDVDADTAPDVVPVTPKYCEPKVALQPGAAVTAIGAGGDISCIIKSGTVYCAGKIATSTDPLKSLFNSTTFAAIPSLAGATHIAVGGAHLCAIMPGNSVKCLGQNIWGQLGDGTFQDAKAAVLVGGAGAMAAISLGGFHSLGATPSGQVVAWGLNSGGQLGIAAMPLKTAVPQAVTLPAGTYAISISAGAMHSVAALSDGTTLAWGNNTLFPLGVGGTGKVLTPAAMQNSKLAFAAAAGADFTLVLGQNCGVSSVGNGALGQLGLGSTATAAALTPIPALSGITAITAGGQHACAVTQAGALYCWGEALVGDPIKAPAQIAGIQSVLQIARGNSHTLALTASGQVFAWGKNHVGQLGLGNTTDKPSPTAVTLN